MHEHVKNMTENLKAGWPEISNSKRVEIHLSSLSYDEFQRLSMEKYQQRQNTQITRVFQLKDPNLEIIYITCVKLSKDIIHYYSKVLELGNIEESKKRLHFILAENSNRFPKHFPASKLLLYSPLALQKIRNIISGKIAYIVPGIPCADDAFLASYLNVPLFQGNYELTYFSSTKTGAKSIFNACKIPTPPSSLVPSDKEEFFEEFVKLIYNNPDITNWVFKINDEFNGRGIASICIEQIKIITDIIHNRVDAEALKLIKLKEILQTLVPLKFKIASPSLFKNYTEFLEFFLKKGGIIEGMPFKNCESSPSIFFVISPSGQINVIASYDKICGLDFLNIGCSFPQTSIPNLNQKALAQQVGEKLYSLGMFGYVTIDLVAFKEKNILPQNLQQDQQQNTLFWAIGLDCFLNNFNCAFFYFDFLMNGKLEDPTGAYIVNTTIDDQELMLSSEDQSIFKKERSFIYLPFVNHIGLSAIQYKRFFHLCRVQQISFDLERKVGSTFTLVDQLENQVISILTIGEDKRIAVKLMIDVLNFILENAGQPKLNLTEGYDSYRFDQIYFMDILNKIRYIKKELETEGNIL